MTALEKQKSSSALRLIVLVILAAGVLGALAFQFFPDPGNSNTHTDEITLQRQMLRLSALRENQGRIAILSTDWEQMFVNATSELATLKLDPTQPDQTFIQTILRRELEAAGAKNVRVSAGDIERLGGGRRVFVSVGFTTSSHRDAFILLLGLSNPRFGYKWQQFTLQADRQAREISLNGEVEVLIMDLPELG